MSLKSIIKCLIFPFITAYMLLCAFIYLDEIKWTKNMMEEDAAKPKQESTSDDSNFSEGSERMDNPNAFVSNCYIGSGYKQERMFTGATDLYKRTGIQLYYVDMDYGLEKFESEKDIVNDIITNEIETLAGIDYSIVVYSYSTDYDYNEDYYYSSDDMFYYGKEVMNYLTSDQLSMIRYYWDNGYDLFGYDDCENQVWCMVAKCISEGFDLDTYTTDRKVLVTDYQQNKVNNYAEDIREYTTKVYLYLAVAVATLILSIVVIVREIKLHKLELQKKEAEVKLTEAMADKVILESDVEFLKDTEDLVSKYYNEES